VDLQDWLSVVCFTSFCCVVNFDAQRLCCSFQGTNQILRDAESSAICLYGSGSIVVAPVFQAHLFTRVKVQLELPLMLFFCFFSVHFSVFSVEYL